MVFGCGLFLNVIVCCVLSMWMNVVGIWMNRLLFFGLFLSSNMCWLVFISWCVIV